jgi:ABC-2 type transport system ATP-binding protein
VLRSRAASGAGALPQVLATLDDARLAVASATVARPSLDDGYLRHTGHSYAAATTQGASA